MKAHKCILIISALDFWSMGKGKGSPSLWKTLNGFADLGYRVYFITSNREKNAIDEVHSNICVIRFNAHYLKKFMKIKKIGFFVKILWWIYFQIIVFIKAQCLHNKIDVIYGYEVDAIPVAKILAKLWGLPLVTRFQGTIFGLGWENKRFRFLRAWEHVVALKIKADLVIMTNDGTQGDKVLRQIGVDKDKIRFWLNGVDWDLFRSIPESKQAKELLDLTGKYVLICISRLVKWKHVERSLNALPKIVKRYEKTVLIIIGDGPERERLERLAFELGVQEHVRFEGAVPHVKVPKYLAAADIFLSFYDWSNVGNPLLEAMMAGKCIVTLNNGDTGRFIRNGENGIMLEYEDLPKLADIIKELLADEKLRDQLGANARKFAEENFWSWEDRIEAEVAEVSRLVEQREKRRYGNE